MSTTVKQPTARETRRAREAAATPPQARDPVRRRWGRIGAGVVAAVLGAWIFAALYLSAGDRSDIVAVANDVERFDTIERSDLRVVRLSRDPDVAAISADRLDEVVGRVAAVDLTAGSLLTERQLRPAGARLLDDNEAIVGVLLRPGDAPSGSLQRGAPVTVVVRAPTGTARSPEEVAGWVFDASAEALNTRERPVEIVVARDEAAMVSAAAAEQRVTVLALAE